MSEDYLEYLIKDVKDLGIQVHEDVYPCLMSDKLSLGFVNFVASLAGEIGSFLGTEEHVHTIETLDTLDAWKMELSSFLNELRCPLNELYKSDIADRFQSSQKKYLLVDYLCSELATARIEKYQEWASQGESQLKALRSLNENLGASLSTFTDPVECVNKVIDTIQSLTNPLRDKLIGQPLFSEVMSSSQIKNFGQISLNLSQEFELRRTMMMTRLSSTLLSFSWSDKIEGKIPNHVEKIISRIISESSSKLPLGMADVLAARKELTVLTKVSSSLPTHRIITQVRIGSVPDRGGRTDEQSETPLFQKRSGPAHTPGLSKPNSKFFKNDHLSRNRKRKNSKW